MNIAFVIYRYFPFGGQQRNMLAMAQEAISRGHAVRVLCREWQGDRPPGVEVELLTVKGLANHAKMASLAASAQERLAAKPADLVVGFVKLPGLQAYYAADPCFAEKAMKRSWWYRLSPRTRTYLSFEESVFGRHAGTHILEVSVRERPYYQRHYGTPDQRFHTLVPGISPSRRAPEDYRVVRNDTRQALGFTPGQHLLLSLGSGFRTKGLDRAIGAVAELAREGNDAHLLVVGQDRERTFRKLAQRLKVADRVHFLGGRDDVPALLQAADALVHPAYRENTGNVLLEAMIAGLPVVATQTCGYAHYIEEAGMGVVLNDSCTARDIAAAVLQLSDTDTDAWHRKGRNFADNGDIYRRPQQAVEILEAIAGGDASP